MNGPPPPNEDSDTPDPNRVRGPTSTTNDNHAAPAGAAATTADASAPTTDEHEGIRQRLIDAMNSRYERANQNESDRRGYNGVGFSASDFLPNPTGPAPEESPQQPPPPRTQTSGPHFFITSPNGPSFLPLPQGVTEFTFPDHIRPTNRTHNEPTQPPPQEAPQAPPQEAPQGTQQVPPQGAPQGAPGADRAEDGPRTSPLFGNGFGGFRFHGFNADGRAPPLHFTSIPPNSNSVYYVVSFRDEERPAKVSERALQNLKRIPLSEIPVDERECTICYEPLTEYVEGAEDDHSPLAIPECGHFFGASCLKAWLQTSASCPLCRAPLEAERSERDDLPFHLISSLFDGFRSQGPSREPSGEPRSSGDNSDSEGTNGPNGPNGQRGHHHHGEHDLHPIIENIFRSIFQRIHEGFRAPNRDTTNEPNTNTNTNDTNTNQQQQERQDEQDQASGATNPWINTGNANATRASGVPVVLGSPPFANFINIVRPSPAVLRERQSRVMRQAFDLSRRGGTRRPSGESAATPTGSASANASPPSPATPSAANTEITPNQPIMWPPQNHLDDLDSIIRNAVRSQRGSSTESSESNSDDTDMRDSEEPSDDPMRRSGPSRRNTTRRHPYQRP